MKIVSGQYSADHGTARCRVITWPRVTPATRSSTASPSCPKELASIEDMTVYENLFVGRELRRGPS